MKNNKTINKTLKKIIISFFTFVLLMTICAFEFVFAFEPSYTENFYNNGLIDLSEEDKLPVANNIIQYVSFPNSIDLSQDKYFPDIKNQGTTGACASWATVYYQYTYQVARLNNWNVKDDSSDSLKFSPKYIYNMLNDGDPVGGSDIESNYKLLQSMGCLRFSDFPFNRNCDFYEGDNDNSTSNALYKALENKVSEVHHYKISKSDTVPVITSNTDSDLYEIKQSLNTGHCITLGTTITSFCYDRLENNDDVCLYLRNVTLSGGHAMTVVGYDDTIWYDLNGDGEEQAYEKGALKLANSYGTNWRNDGYIWVMYDALNKVSNVSALNFDNRGSFIRYEDFYTIDVNNNEPQMTAEITIGQKIKNDFTISLGYSDTFNSTVYSKELAFNKKSGQNSFDGSENTYYTRTFVFDYSTCVYKGYYDYGFSLENMYAGSNKVYWAIVRDVNSNNDADTRVIKIIWRDSDGNVIKEISPNNILNGTSYSYDNITSPAFLNTTTSD